MPAEPKGAKWTPAPRVVSTIHYRQDQVGYLEDGFTHLFVVPADGGTARQLTTGKWSVGSGELRGGASIDWTPDSKSIVFDGNRSPDADMQYETSQIYVADVATGAIRELVTKAGEWGKPVVSPDGRTVAFTGYAPTGHSHTVSDMWVVPISGGSADMRKISGDFDRDPINMKLGAGRHRRLFRRRRPRRAQHPVRGDRRRRQAADQRPPDADVRLGVEGRHRRRHRLRSRSPAGRRQVQRAAAGTGDEAHRRQRRRAAGHAARRRSKRSPTRRPATRR